MLYFVLFFSCVFVSETDYSDRLEALVPEGCSFILEYVDGEGVISTPEGALDYVLTLKDIALDAEDLPYDGIDQNCDGKDDFDIDGDGFVPNQYEGIVTTGVDSTLPAGDCDDEDVARNPGAVEICDDIDNDCDDLVDDEDDNIDESQLFFYYADADGDGFGDENNYERSCSPIIGYVANDRDCDDTVVHRDADNDGFLSCKGDCDDSDAYTYPGAAELESSNACMRDADQDGFGDLYVNCYLIEMLDDFGDGWQSFVGNGYIEVQNHQGVVISRHYPLETDHCTDLSLCNNYQAATYLAFEVCAQYEPLVLYYVPDAFPFENSLRITDPAGNITEYGDMFFYPNGEPKAPIPEGLVYSTQQSSLIHGFDCDDSDNAIGSGDFDRDGFDACDVENPLDCDDSDASIHPRIDVDGDGANICVDCNDADNTMYPFAEEIWYDGIDQDCDGWSDYDKDKDGADTMSYIDPTDGITRVFWTGYDCNDNDDRYLPLPNEANPNACYFDSDGDGFGVSLLSSYMLSFGVVSGTDCADFSEIGYPGAAYNELDVDGDGITDCTFDYDGDGYGSATTTYGAQGTDCEDFDSFVYPGAAYNELDVDGDGAIDCTLDADGDGYGSSNTTIAALGSDCNDSDALINPTLDADNDGAHACEDCDENDASTQGFLAFLDLDHDGYGGYSSGTYVCALDIDQDGFDDYVLNGDDCNDSFYPKAPYTYPGAAFMEEDVNGDGIIDCTQDVDGDGYGEIAGESDYFISGTDCNDSDEFTYPGAGFNEVFPVNGQCLTDADGDGYAADILGLYETFVSSGDCFYITIKDSYSDGCGAFADMYIDGILYTSIEGPASGLAQKTTQWCASVYGYWQVGWTEDTTWNSDCELVIANGSGTELYNSGSSTISGVIPGGGTDSNDANASIH